MGLYFFASLIVIGITNMVDHSLESFTNEAKFIQDISSLPDQTLNCIAYGEHLFLALSARK